MIGKTDERGRDREKERVRERERIWEVEKNVPGFGDGEREDVESCR